MLYPVKLEYREYPSGVYTDWSEYIVIPPSISRKAESENEGEAGVIVFDSAKITLNYEFGNPVYNAFSIDLTNKQRYLFRISIYKSSGYEPLFEGMADFGSIEWDEDGTTITFNIVDKLSALGILPLESLRGGIKHLLYDKNPDASVNKISVVTGTAATTNHHKWIGIKYLSGTLIKPTTFSNTPAIGEIIQSPYDEESLALVIYKGKDINNQLDSDNMYLDLINFDTTYPKPSGNQKDVQNLFYYINEVYGVDLLVKEYVTGYNIYFTDAGNTYSITLTGGYKAVAYDGIKLITTLVKSQWPEITVILKPSNLEYRIPLEYYLRLINEAPLDTNPLDALKMCADSMKCYIYIDREGRLVIQEKSENTLPTSGITRTLGNTQIISQGKKYFWNKLVDGVTVEIKSWVTDPETGEYLTGVGIQTKQIPGSNTFIKPKNEIKKSLLAPVSNPPINTQELLNQQAAIEALNILNFYGKRRASFNLKLNLDDNVLAWDLLDNIQYKGINCFFTQLEMDLNDRIATVELVEIGGHDYDPRQIIFTLSDESISRGFASESVTNYYTSNTGYVYNAPLNLSGGIVSLLTTDNLKLTSNQLDTMQPIKTTDTPTFNQLTLNSAATLSNHSVRADRTLNTSAPLTGGGDLTADRTIGLSYNATNLKLTSNALNTIQDIATSSSPTFAQLILSNAGTTTSNAVRADRSIGVSAPLTGGGNLTADRTLGLSYNTTNLKLTSNQLNTIQDIATTSTPTFAGLNVTDSIVLLGYNSWIGTTDNVGFALRTNNADRLIVSNAGNVGIGTTSPSNLFDVYGTSNSQTNALVRFQNTYSATWVPVAEMLAPNLANGQTAYFALGKSASNYNRVAWSYKQVGLGSTSNYMSFGFYGADYLVNILANGNVGIGTTSPSFKLDVNGTGRFVGVLQLDTQATATNHALAAGRNISTSAPLTGGGNLTADRTLGLSYNTTNLKLTSNQLNTIQDIATTSSPTFNSLTLTGIITQQQTTGTNSFATDISQSGNKSIYNNFTSGWTGSGWRVDYGITATNRSHLELDDLTVRGTMRVYELIINQIRATNGSLFVSSSAKVESVTRTPGDPVTYTIIFEDPEGYGVCPFLVNDIIIVQRVRLDSTTIVKQIICQVTNVTGKVITASVVYENGQITKGDLVVRIGNTSNTNRQGSVYLTSDDSNAPYIDIVDGVNSWSAWSSSNKLKVRLGKLTGITDSFFGSLSGYGLYAKSNAYLRGKIYAEQGGWIAGWDINASSLTSPLISSNYKISLVADNTNSVVGAYADINIGGANPLFISFGRIKTGTSSYSANYGLSAKTETGDDYFELSNNVRHIAGWNFDTQKLYKGLIELNSSTNSVGVNSNKVKMFYTNASNWGIEGRDSSNNLTFQLGSTNKIAGWIFNNEHIYKLASGTPTSSPVYGLTISATSTAQAIIAYGSNWQRYVKMGYQTSGNWFGIEGTDNNANIVFQLGSTNKISGWNFDTTKFSNGIVSLEASASMKGLVVDTDWIRVGDFTTSTLSVAYTNVSQIYIGFSNPTIRSNDNAWGAWNTVIHRRDDATGNIEMARSDNLIQFRALNEEQTEADDVDEVKYQVIHNLYTSTSTLVNRKIKLHFKLKAIKWVNATNWHNLNCNVYLIYFSSGWGILKTLTVFSQTIAESSVTFGTPYVIDKTGSNAVEFYLPGNISDVANIYIAFSAGFLIGGSYRKALNFQITDFDIESKVGAKIQANKDGIEIYNSDENYFRFRNNLLEINSANIKSNGKQISRYLGRLSSAPGVSDNVFEGDIYVKSTDNTVWICYGFSNETPLWKQIG